MYLVVVFALVEWMCRGVYSSFEECRNLKAMVNTTADPDFRAIYVQRVLAEDANVRSSMFMTPADALEDACNVPMALAWIRIVGTIVTLFVTLPHCIRLPRATPECAVSSLPTNPEKEEPPPIFPPKLSPTVDLTESASTVSSQTPPGSPCATPDSPCTPRLLYNPSSEPDGRTWQMEKFTHDATAMA